MVGTGSGDGRLINGDDGTIGVGDQVGVEVEGAAVAVSNWGSVSNRDGSDRSGSNNGTSGSKGSSLGGEVVGTGSGDGRLINRDDSSVGVGDQVGVQVEGTSVAVSRGVGRGSCVANVSNGGGSVSNGTSCNNGSSSELGRKMVGLQSGHTGLVDGSDGSVGVTLQAKEALGGGERETGSENLKENFDSLFTQDSLLELTRNFMMYLAVC